MSDQSEPLQKKVGCERLHGTGVSEGVVVGNAFRVDHGSYVMPDRRIQTSEIAAELEKLRRAMEMSKKQLEEVRQNLAETLGSDHAEIFDGYMMIVEDPS